MTMLQLNDIIHYFKKFLLLEFPDLCLFEIRNPRDTYTREATPDNNIIQCVTLRFGSLGKQNGVSLFDCRPGTALPNLPYVWMFRVRFVLRRTSPTLITLEYIDYDVLPKTFIVPGTDAPQKDGAPINNDEFLKYIKLLKLYFDDPSYRDKLKLLILAVGQDPQLVTRDFTLENRPRDVETFEPVKFSTATDVTVYFMVNKTNFYRLDYLASWYYTRMTTFPWQPIPDPQSNLPITSIQKVIIKPMIKLDARQSTQREREMQMTEQGIFKIEGIKRRRSLGGGKRR